MSQIDKFQTYYLNSLVGDEAGKLAAAELGLRIANEESLDCSIMIGPEASLNVAAAVASMQAKVDRAKEV